MTWRCERRPIVAHGRTRSHRLVVGLHGAGCDRSLIRRQSVIERTRKGQPMSTNVSVLAFRTRSVAITPRDALCLREMAGGPYPGAIGPTHR